MKTIFNWSLRSIVLLLFSFVTLFCFATKLPKKKNQERLDTNKVYQIGEVTVCENYRRSEIRSTAPLQILSSKNIEQLNALQVSDAVKYFTGVSVKDYGGIGGLKTVSVRSLGASHTAVSYDGITISDCQTGQIDIGRFSLDNVDMLSLNNGQSDQIFQPARLFASASVLNIKTLTPHFQQDENYKGKVAFKGGSFGLINPSFYHQHKLSKHYSVTLSGEYLGANGEYPYTLHYGQTNNDSTSREKRNNTDVNNLRFETSVYADYEHTRAYLKYYLYNSERGLPGATIFYNTDNFSSQRLWDRTQFLQGHLEHDFTALISAQINTKYNRAYMRYLDPTYLNTLGKEDARYTQQEYYLSASVLYRAFDNLSFDISSDIFYNVLDANQIDFSYPKRTTNLNVIAAKYVDEHFLATASLLHTQTFEKVESGKSAKNQNRFSPFMSISYKPFTQQDLRFRLFYKNIFRLPTFNDLYYSRVGNPDLKPEDTHQYNLGLTYSTSIGERFPLLSATVDIYHNDVKNKIVAFPSKNIYTWTMLNYGKVAIDGMDITLEGSLAITPKTALILGGTYTYQRSVNTTDPNGRTYKHQIPYTPRTSGSAKAALETSYATLAYTVIFSGDRFTVNQNYAENRISGYQDHSLSLNIPLKFFKNNFNLQVECLNIANTNYEVVRYFPMPGRSFRATLTWKY